MTYDKTRQEMDKDGSGLLSKRLMELAKMVTPGNTVADVGCDHGFLSIYLVMNDITPRAIAMDVRTGPLQGAKEHVVQFGLGEKIETRLSDGVTALEIAEAETMICAGMGGPLMEKILTDHFEVSCSFKELILQPQSEIQEFREFLRNSGFQIVDERAVFDEGKYYFPIKAVYVGNSEEKVEPAKLTTAFSQEVYDCYGQWLIERKDAVLTEYLLWKKNQLEKTMQSIKGSEKERAQLRYKEVAQELNKVCSVLEWMMS